MSREYDTVAHTTFPAGHLRSASVIRAYTALPGFPGALSREMLKNQITMRDIGRLLDHGTKGSRSYTVARWFKGKDYPSRPDADAIAKLFSTTPEAMGFDPAESDRFAAILEANRAAMVSIRAQIGKGKATTAEVTTAEVLPPAGLARLRTRYGALQNPGSFSTNLRAIMEAKGISQGRLGGMVNTTQSTISYIIRTNRVQKTMATKIAHALGTTVGALRHGAVAKPVVVQAPEAAPMDVWVAGAMPETVGEEALTIRLSTADFGRAVMVLKQAGIRMRI